MTARDDLEAGPIRLSERYGEARRRFSDPLTRNAFMAGAAWASERSRPRVVTTAVELDALPLGAVVVIQYLDSRSGARFVETWEKHLDESGWYSPACEPAPTSTGDLFGPWQTLRFESATVVWSPPAETDGTTSSHRQVAPELGAETDGTER